MREKGGRNETGTKFGIRVKINFVWENHINGVVGSKINWFPVFVELWKTSRCLFFSFSFPFSFSFCFV